ncbi:YkgJ family cysteine cluster protein [Acidovorax sp.]|uniref:YkgJ family cysteine cluster protein n=1 Tax=Acidovorax sp. TaxID=1872122 RepID=UPI0027B8F893|nr:YkgJ family cysteine cluster protein [Acidovorax sp.]
MSDLKAEGRAEHLRRVRERESVILSPLGGAGIDARAMAVLRPAEADRRRLVSEALRAPSRAKAIVWLHKAADRLGNAVASEVACRRGCDACCHLDVLVSQAEAELIGRAIDRKPVAAPAGAVPVGRDLDQPPDVAVRHYGSPCPFLQSGACSIYRDRPLMCRLNASFDSDALLCQIVPGATISVPYVDASIEKAIYHAKVAAGGLVADLRDWFPAGKQEERKHGH